MTVKSGSNGRTAVYDRAVTRAYDTQIFVGSEEVTLCTHLGIVADSIRKFLDIDVQWTVHGNG